MKIHLRQIPQGETVHLEDDLDPAFLDLDAVGGEAVSPVHAALDVGISGSGLFATGSLGVRARLSCVKCLQPFEMDLLVPDFAMQTELDGRESVDLTPALREDILLVLPSYPRCDVDGSTTCPATFQNAPGAPLIDETDHSAWDALDQFKPKK